MQTHEIPREQWPEFFDSFSRQHHGWLVTIRVMGEDIGVQVEANEMPLEGISADIKGPGEDEIYMTAGQESDRQVTHIISAPRRVQLEQSDEGADETLQVEEEGRTTLVQFRSSMRPDQVDGI